jgi:hypothetical protein
MEPALSPAQLAIAALRSLAAWARAHSLQLVFIGAFALAGYRMRHAIQDLLATLLWLMSTRLPIRRRVVSTISLLERRSRLAGCGRPRSVTPPAWCAALCAHASESTRAGADTLRAFAALAEWTLYAPSDRRLPAILDPNTCGLLCNQLVRDLTLGHFRSIARERSSGASRK